MRFDSYWYFYGQKYEILTVCNVKQWDLYNSRLLTLNAHKYQYLAIIWISKMILTAQFYN